MITLIAAALAASAPAAAPMQPMDVHAQHEQMAGHQPSGEMADMKDCCCHDMMSKMHEGHGADMHGNKGHSGR